MNLVTPKKVLVGCNVSGAMMHAIWLCGHHPVSCDLKPAEHDHGHIRCDIRDVLNGNWDAMIAFPPCTYLSKAGIHFLWDSTSRMESAADAVQLFRSLLYSDIPQVILENPPGLLGRTFQPPHQIVRPWYFGDPYNKDIGLWFKNSPPIIATLYSTGRKSVNNHTNSRMSTEQRAAVRSSWYYFPHMCVAIARQSFGVVPGSTLDLYGYFNSS